MSNDNGAAATGARKTRKSTFGRGLRREYVPLWVPSPLQLPNTSAKKKKTLGSGRREGRAANSSGQVSDAVVANASSSIHSVHRRLFDMNEPSTSTASTITSLASTCKKFPGRLTPNISVSKIRRNIALRSNIPKMILPPPQNTMRHMVSKPSSSSGSKSRTAQQKPSIPRIMPEDKSDKTEIVNQEALPSDELTSPQTAMLEEIIKMSSLFAVATEKQNDILLAMNKGIEKQNDVLSALMELLKKKFIIKADQRMHSDNDSEDDCLNAFEEDENRTLAQTLISDSVVHDETVSNAAGTSSKQPNEVKPKCRKSIVLYNTMRSEITCLKTPLGKSTDAPALSATPKTNLSRRLQNQLEELFDSDSSK